MKKEWKKPELNIIARSTNEENVLWACKGVSGTLGSSGGPYTYICGYDWDTQTYCHGSNNS